MDQDLEESEQREERDLQMLQYRISGQSFEKSFPSKSKKAYPDVVPHFRYEHHLARIQGTLDKSHTEGTRPLEAVISEFVEDEKEIARDALNRDGFYVQGDPDVYEQMVIYTTRCKCGHIETITIPFGPVSGFISLILSQRQYALDNQRH